MARHTLTRSAVEEARNVVVFEGGLPPLLALLRSRSFAVQEHACVTLRHLTSTETNRAKLVKENGVFPLIEMLQYVVACLLASRCSYTSCNGLLCTRVCNLLRTHRSVCACAHDEFRELHRFMTLKMLSIERSGHVGPPNQH
jgi:hypothetical protein